jgi:hypothetical protein
VQAGAAAVGGGDQVGDRGGAVGGQDRGRQFDLDLEAERAGGQPVRVLEFLQDGDQGGDLVGTAHLGQRQVKRVLIGRQEQVEGAQRAAAGGGFQ